MSIRFDGRVAIVTGAGNGLGRAYALALAERGAKVVVNDRGGARDGTGTSTGPAQTVADAVIAAGGDAIADTADVSNPEEVQAMVDAAMGRWGRIDILVNNAGILRDKSFAKMELDEFTSVIDVHLIGSAICSKCVWGIMRQQAYGRILFTSSGSGIYGNFGQANYGAAKAGMIGLMNVLHIEGEKYNIRVNTLAPTAGTRMTEELLPPDVVRLMSPESIAPGVLYLVSEDAPSRVILSAGAGTFARIHILETEGVYLPPEERTPEAVAARFDAISDPAGQRAVVNAFEQTAKLVGKGAKAGGVKLPFGG